jgi:predicted NBD/HSP70 family sugar kinase
VLREAAEALGTAIATAVQILNPSLVVLAGKLFQAAGSIILPTINEALHRDCFEIFLRHLRIRLSTAEKDVSARGCALLGASSIARSVLHRRLSVGLSATAM